MQARMKQQKKPRKSKEQMSQLEKRLIAIELFIRQARMQKFSRQRRSGYSGQRQQQTEKKLTVQKHLEEMKIMLGQKLKQDQQIVSQLTKEQLDQINKKTVDYEKNVANLNNQLNALRQGNIDMKSQYTGELDRLRTELQNKVENEYEKNEIKNNMLGINEGQPFQESIFDEFYYQKPPIEQDYKRVAVDAHSQLQKKGTELRQQDEIIQQQDEIIQQQDEKEGQLKQRQQGYTDKHKQKKNIEALQEGIRVAEFEIQEIRKKKKKGKNDDKRIKQYEDKIKEFQERLQKVQSAEGTNGEGLTHQEVDDMADRLLLNFEPVVFAENKWEIENDNRKDKMIDTEIINDNHHYKAIVVDKKHQNVCWYDPFGDPPNQQQLQRLKNLCGNYQMKLKINTIKTQPDYSDLCGLHCITFLKKYQDSDGDFKFSTHFTEKNIKNFPPFQMLIK